MQVSAFLCDPDGRRLRSLGLHYNALGPASARSIGAALRCSTSNLTELSLYGNSLGPEGGVALAEALAAEPGVLSALVRMASKRAV